VSGQYVGVNFVFDGGRTNVGYAVLREDAEIVFTQFNNNQLPAVLSSDKVRCRAGVQRWAFRTEYLSFLHFFDLAPADQAQAEAAQRLAMAQRGLPSFSPLGQS
jgi:hypothetical protein